MKLKMSYGHLWRKQELPEAVPVDSLEPKPEPALTDPAASVRPALRHPTGPPIGEVVRPGEPGAIVPNDVTRISRALVRCACYVVIASAGGSPFGIDLRQAHDGMENAALGVYAAGFE